MSTTTTKQGPTKGPLAALLSALYLKNSAYLQCSPFQIWPNLIFYDAKFFFGLECVSDNSKKSFKKNISRFFFQKKIRSKSSKISRKKISMKKSLFSRLWVFLNYFSPLITFRMVKKLKLVPENIYFSFNLCWHFSPCIHFLAFFRPFWTSFGWFQPNFVDLLSAFV